MTKINKTKKLERKTELEKERRKKKKRVREIIY